MPIESLDELTDPVRSVIETETRHMIDQYDPLGILLVGSYANGMPSDYSDIDLYIIARQQDWRERGNYIKNGYEIEYFINPVRQIRAYFQRENGIQRHTAHMFATGIVLYQQEPVVDELIAEARTHFEEHKSTSEIEIELAQYSLDDGQKDLLNMVDDQDTLAYQLTATRLFHQILRIFFRHHQMTMTKSTMLMGQINDIDPEFASLVKSVVDSCFAYAQINKLVTYTEDLLGGKRDDTWKLRTPLDLKND